MKKKHRIQQLERALEAVKNTLNQPASKPDKVDILHANMLIDGVLDESLYFGTPISKDEGRVKQNER